MRLLAERAALRENAARLLDELGGTASEVAMSLRSMGLRVGPSDRGDSPAARYLHAVVGPDTQVKRIRVTKRWLVLKTHRRWCSTIRLRLPHPVREFTISILGTRPNQADDMTEMTEVPFDGDQP
jgi:hypothetical protein